MKVKIKARNGITLMALIITIVVLLILASVAITSILEYNIIKNANLTIEKYDDETNKEGNILGKYNKIIEEYIVGKNSEINSDTGITLTVTDVKNKILSTTLNTDVYDEYGNKIVIPAGFKILVDDTTNNVDTVNEGIVIEDVRKNQFVWIPVGKIYTDKTKTEANAKNIILGRYLWNGSIETLIQPVGENTYKNEVTMTISTGVNYTECQSTTITSNSKSKNINDFYESVMGTATKMGNGGYYLGRYEAGDGDSTKVEERTGKHWYVKQIKYYIIG